MGRGFVFLFAVACGSRSDLSPRPAESCEVRAMATRACTSLAFRAPATELDFALGNGNDGTLPTQLIDRGDHIDAITATTVTSLTVSDGSISVSGSRSAPDLCGTLAASGDLFASLCDTPFTVFRVYDANYTRIAEREIATPSAANAIVGGASSWLVAWDGFAAVLGADTQPLIAPTSENGSFVATPCGFVGMGATGADPNPVSLLTLSADFSAPSGALTPFDAIQIQQFAPSIGVVRWPYDGVSIAAAITPGSFDIPTSTQLDVVSPHVTTTLQVDFGGYALLIATPIGLIAISSQGFGGSSPVFDVIGPDGHTTATLTSSDITIVPAAMVWSADSLVIVWERYDTGKLAVFGAAIECAD